MKWEVKRLGEVCDSYNGLWTGKKEPLIKIGVVRNANFTKDCKLKHSNIIFIDVEKKKFDKNRKLKYGDIIIERSGGSEHQLVGRPVIFDIEDGDYSFSNFTSALRIKDAQPITFQFLHRYLYHFYLSGGTAKMQSNTIGLHNLDFKAFLDIPVPVPSLSEQERIVCRLDALFSHLDALQSNTRRAIDDAKELFQSKLQQAMNKGWEEKILGEVCEVLDYRRIPITKDKRSKGNIPYYGASGIQDYVKDFIFDEDLVLLGEDGAKWGAGDNSSYTISGKTWVNNHAHVLRPYRNIVKDNWLVYYLNYSDLTGYITGVTVPKLNQQKMRTIPIPLPPLSEQERIVSELDALSQSIEQLQANFARQTASIEELRQSTLHEAFEGNI